MLLGKQDNENSGDEKREWFSLGNVVFRNLSVDKMLFCNPLQQHERLC